MGRSLFANLREWMNGLSLLMMLVMVWSCFRLFCIVMPRRGACVLCSRIVFWIAGLGLGGVGRRRSSLF